MHIHVYTFTIVILLPLLSLSYTKRNDDGGVLANSLSSFMNYLKHKQRLYPLYPYANRNGWPLKYESYDFIIVGASPSGIVLANRLSVNPKWKILLLEAGEEPAFPTEIPSVAGFTSFSEYDWGYRTEKQEGFCRGCTNGNVFWAHGKGLGGSTITNFMLYVRGNKRDFQKWYEQGNPGWSFEEVLPYFLELEDSSIALGDDGYHGRGGSLKISNIPYRSRSADVWVEAAQQAGYPYVDYNGKQQYGVSYVQGTVSHGERWSAEKGFLRPIRNRRNLTIRINALVSKVLIGKNNTAYGVEYIKNGRTRRVFAHKEVILSAGGLNSPQILMLSGIGPGAHLQDLGIPVIKDLPVGKQIYDHATFPALEFFVNDSITVNLAKVVTNPNSYVDYALNRTGPLTLGGGIETLTYIKSAASEDPDPKYPDIELLFVSMILSADFGLFYRRLFNIPPSMYDKVWKPLENKNGFSVFPMLLHPESYGFLKLRSRNPRDAPLFYANYLSDPAQKDVEAFISSIRIAQKIVSMPAWQKYGARIVDTPIPGCEHLTFDSDEYWNCALHTIFASLWHQVGACRMGPSEDHRAVVDKELRVHGMNRLMVADTSIIPVTLSAHTSAAAYLIGAKADHYIRRAWNGSFN